jgi:hypothetical protein
VIFLLGSISGIAQVNLQIRVECSRLFSTVGCRFRLALRSTLGKRAETARPHRPSRATVDMERI